MFPTSQRRGRKNPIKTCRTYFQNKLQRSGYKAQNEDQIKQRIRLESIKSFKNRIEKIVNIYARYEDFSSVWSNLSLVLIIRSEFDPNNSPHVGWWQHCYAFVTKFWRFISILCHFKKNYNLNYIQRDTSNFGSKSDSKISPHARWWQHCYVFVANRYFIKSLTLNYIVNCQICHFDVCKCSTTNENTVIQIRYTFVHSRTILKQQSDIKIHLHNFECTYVNTKKTIGMCFFSQTLLSLYIVFET